MYCACSYDEKTGLVTGMCGAHTHKVREYAAREVEELRKGLEREHLKVLTRKDLIIDALLHRIAELEKR